MAGIYLELQNVSNVLNPLLVDFHPPRFDLVNAAGESIEQSPMSASIANPPPYTLVLPIDSSLRFRVSVSGWGIRREGGIALPMPSEFWLIPPGTQDARFL